MAPLRHLTAPTEIRPWGGYQNLFEAEGLKVKLLEVSPSGRLSLQRHRKRSEHWTVMSGIGTFELDGARSAIIPGDQLTIGVGQVHRVANAGDEPLLIIELQRGVCEESDIERLEDDYGRIENRT